MPESVRRRGVPVGGDFGGAGVVCALPGVVVTPKDGVDTTSGRLLISSCIPQKQPPDQIAAL
jgi:hypothetical protein